MHVRRRAREKPTGTSHITPQRKEEAKMGVHDEHWCSKCHKELDKVKETYFEMSIVNAPLPKTDEEPKHNRAFLCKKCYDEEEGLKEASERLRKRGNPTFTLQLFCGAALECPDFEPSPEPCVNCKYIYALKDRLYCGRRHPGEVLVNVDKAAIDDEILLKFNTFLSDMMGEDVVQRLGQGLGLLTPISLDSLRSRVPHVIIPGEPGPLDKNRTIILPDQEEEIPQFPIPFIRKRGPLNNRNTPS